MIMSKPNQKFSSVQIVATPAAIEALDSAGKTATEFLARHFHGDWGIVCDDDKQANDVSLIDGSRLLSAYRLSTGQKIWIITEAADDRGNRSATTVLLPEEY